MKRALLVFALAGCASSESGVPSDGGAVDAPTDAEGAAGDGFPTGAISFFMTTACPSGWTEFADAAGRTIVPSAGADVGVAVGTPLGSNEARAHHHDLSLDVELPAVSFAGIAGEANHGVARSGAANDVTVTDDGAAALPTVQLLACRKTAPAGDAAPPPGVIAFFADATCPDAWAELEALRGHLLVALPDGGLPATYFGGTPLTSGEQRTHMHDVDATVTGGSHGIALASGCCADGYGAAGDHAATGSATAASADVPYLQLLACVAL